MGHRLQAMTTLQGIMKQPPPPAPRAPRRNLAVLSACQSANRFTSSQHEVNHIKGASPGGADAKGLGGGVSKGEAGSRSAYQLPVFCIDAQGSFGGSDSPFCSSPMGMPSGERTKAMWPSRGGR